MQLITPPTAEPVTVDEARQAARADAGTFDAELPRHIAAARQVAEQHSSQRFMAQTWRAEVADWSEALQPHKIAGATAVAVSYWSGSAWVVLNTATYTWAEVDAHTCWAPNSGTTLPALGDRPVGGRVRVDITAGATDAAAVPACAKSFILAVVAHCVDNPSATVGSTLQQNPFLTALLDPVRLYY